MFEHQQFRHYNSGIFTLELTVPQLEPTDKWNGSRRVHRLTRNFHINIQFPGGILSMLIPRGFESDMASFPMLLQLILGNRDDYLEESLIHDWLYREGIPVFFANAMMRVVMTQLRRKAWKRWVVFYGLMFLGYRAPGWQWLRKFKKGPQ
jgi:hypothetical protein